MDILKPLFAASGLIAGVAVAVVACEAVVPPDQYFNPQGITSVVSYSNEAPPTALTAAGSYVFYAEGSALYRLAVANPTPQPVPVTLAGPITSMQFDGVSTLAFCAGGVLSAIDAETLAPVSVLRSQVGSCLQIALSPTRVAYTATTDGGAPFVLSVSRNLDAGEGTRQGALLEAGADDPARAGIALVGEHAYYVWRNALVELGAQPSLSLGDAGLVTHGVGEAGLVDDVKTECVVRFLQPANNPKIVVFDAGADGGPVTSLILRANANDSLHRIDVNPADPSPCKCTYVTRATSEACLSPSLVEQAPGGQGDFLALNGFFYYGDEGLVRRLPLDQVFADASVDKVAPLIDIPGSAPIPSLVVVGQSVFFILGDSIFEASVPPQ